MVTAVFKNSNTERVRGLWQYDYGQVLRIQGLILPTAVEIDFSLQETGGESTSRVGITRDGVTDVVIPDSMLENGGATQNYSIYAFIYLTDETSGETIKKIIMSVTSRPKPEAFDAPEDAELFREAIADVNKSAGRAETAEASAEAWAHGHADYPERDEDNAKHYADESKKDAEETKKERTAVSELAEHIDAVAMQVNEDKTDTDQYKDQASASAAKALQSEQAAKSSETAAMEAQAGAEAAEGQAELFAAQTEEDKNTVEQAKDVVMGIGQEVVENRNYVQQSVGSFGLIHQQAVTDVNNAGQTQTERVEEAGTAQVSAVQEAASEIIADREQISNNKNSIDSLKGDLGDLDSEIFGFNIVGISSIEYTKGGFVNENGTITDNANFMYSDFIEVREGQEIEYSINAYNAQVITISAWKYDKTFVLNKSVYGKVSSANVLSGVYTVPSDIRYIRITRWSVYNYGDNDSADIPLKYSIVSEANETVNEVKEYAYGLTKTVVSANLYNEKDTDVKAGYYLDTDGTEKSASTCRITGFIKVKPNTKYSKNYFVSLSLDRIGGAYDKDKNWISNITGVKHESVSDFTTPFNTEYVRLNVTNSNGTTMVTEGDYTQFPTEYIGYENYTTVREDILLNEKQLAQAQASNWKGKVWHGFGTSITNTSNEGKYANYLAEISGMTFVNHGYSGGCIGSGSGVANSQIINMIDSANLSNADLVTVEGFVNDWSQCVPIGDNTDKTTETLKGAIYVAITKLLSKTNATIIFLTDHTGRLFNSTDIRRTVLRNGKTQDDYRKATIEMCNYLNIPVIDVGRKCMISEDTPNYLVDQIHHTEKGGEQFARTVWSELKNIMQRIV